MLEPSISRVAESQKLCIDGSAFGISGHKGKLRLSQIHLGPLFKPF